MHRGVCTRFVFLCFQAGGRGTTSLGGRLWVSGTWMGAMQMGGAGTGAA